MRRPASSFMYFFSVVFFAFFSPSRSLMLSSDLSSFYIFTKKTCVCVVTSGSFGSFFGFIASWYIIFIHFWYDYDALLRRFFACSVAFALSFGFSCTCECRLLSFLVASSSLFKQTMRAVKRFIFNVTAFSECLCVHFSVFLCWSKGKFFYYSWKIYNENSKLICECQNIDTQWIDLNFNIFKVNKLGKMVN